MGEKLKSITNPTRWYSLLKPLAVAIAWFFLPTWVFFLVALYCYLVPLFRASTLLGPFVMFMILGLVVPSGIFQAFYAAIIFGLLLGIKDLTIVNRGPAYEVLAFLLSFAGFLVLFEHFAAWSTAASFLWLTIVCLMWLWLILAAPDRKEVSILSAAVASLILFEVGAVMFLLPLSFFSQASLMFFASALLFVTVFDSTLITAKRFFGWGGAYAAISLIVVFLTSWKV